MKVLRLLTKPMKTNNMPMKEVTRLLYCADDIYEGWNFNSGNLLFTTDTK